VTTQFTQVGRNEIPRRKPVSPWRLFLKQFASPFVLVLLFAAALAYGVSVLPGESDRRLTAYFILAIVLLSVGLSFYEEYRAQVELVALNKLLVFTTLVIRDGKKFPLNASELVPGDIIELTHGQKVPADARVLEVHALRVDESALTGESVGIDKSPLPVPRETPLADRTSMVYGSTYVTRGTGLAVVVQTGMHTEVGKIATTLQQMRERPTPFQREVTKMARQMTVLVGVLAIIVAILLVFVLHEPWVDVALNTLSLAIATIPESLPVVLTFALALGAHAMARHHAVVQRLAVVESLGSVDTICTDKTGTLTQNVMTVQRVYADGQSADLIDQRALSEPSLEILRAGVLCNDAVMTADTPPHLSGDPVDVALLRAAQQAHLDIAATRTAYPKINEAPFSAERKMMTTVHTHEGTVIAVTKGAAEEVLARCLSSWCADRDTPLQEEQRQQIIQHLQEWERHGLYVLALAQQTLPDAENTDQLERGMSFLGMIGLIDPPRPEVAGAIVTAKDAGIRVVMITGDHLLAAQAIAQQLGLATRAVEGSELAPLSPNALQTRMSDIDIVARATPEIKQRILQAIQQGGHFVAMTGDGVNDATALRQADIGVAMGLRGTDIAKESAAMVLLDDNFATIIAAIHEGRRIFDNIRKFTNYLLSTSLGEVFVVLTLSAMGYFPLSAQMLLWINVVTDVVPASALAADPAVPQVMTRRPRRHDEPILNAAIYATIAGSIFRTLIAYALVFWVGLLLGGVVYARTVLFTSIVLHAFTRVMVVRQLDNLSLWSNRALLWSYGVAVGLQIVALYTPLRIVFGVVPLDWRAWALMVSVVVLSSVTGVYMTRWILQRFPLWSM